MAEVEVKPCSNPGCDQPGKSSCSACNSTVYCCVICQTADWPRHKEECDGHLRKIGKANLAKAHSFYRDNNWKQSLHYAEIAVSKLTKLKDRRLETVEIINEALACKCETLQFMCRYRESKGAAEERYTLWAMNFIRNPGSMKAAFSLFQSCLNSGEFDDALRYGHHALFMINEMTDNFIPSDKRPQFLAHVSCLLATATFRLAEAGGIPPAEKQKMGEDSIVFARQALEIHTRLCGAGSSEVAIDLIALGDVLGFFNDVDDDEIPRYYQRAIQIFARTEGALCANVATANHKLACAFQHRARRADEISGDYPFCLVNYELALPHYREAVRIYRINNHTEHAEQAQELVARAMDNIQRLKVVIGEEVPAAAVSSTNPKNKKKVGKKK